MITLIATALLVQQGSYFAKTFPNPTGNNGWEEYLMAADIVSGPEVTRLLVGEGMNDRSSVARTVLRRFGRVGDLIRAGNKKPLDYPWSDRDEVVSNFPEYAALKVPARVLACEAEVAFADGKPGVASKSILDALEFSRRISGKTTVGGLVSIALQSMAMRSLAFGLPKLGLDEARDLRHAFEKAASERSTLADLYLQEFRRWRHLVPEALADPDSLAESPDEVPPGVRNLTPERAKRYSDAILQRMTTMEQEARQMFEKEERFWKAPDATDPDPVVEFVASRLSPAQITQALVRNATQLRLAALHCRIIEFKRTFNKLPNTLAELNAPDRVYDRTTGGPYFYARLLGQSYVLFSLGTSETGRIDLIYRREYLDGDGQ